MLKYFFALFLAFLAALRENCHFFSILLNLREGEGLCRRRATIMLQSLDPRIRLALALLVFLNVTVFGCLCLLFTGKIVP
jgi:hypothetical protein